MKSNIKHKKTVDNSGDIPAVLSDDVQVNFKIRAAIIQPYDRPKVKEDTRRAADEYEEER